MSTQSADPVSADSPPILAYCSPCGLIGFPIKALIHWPEAVLKILPQQAARQTKDGLPLNLTNKLQVAATSRQAIRSTKTIDCNGAFDRLIDYALGQCRAHNLDHTGMTQCKKRWIG